MRKNQFFYLGAAIMLCILLWLFTKAYGEINRYSDLSNRHNAVLSHFQEISRQVNNAAVLNPDLTRVISYRPDFSPFFTDSTSIVKQLELLKAAVKDTINIKIAVALDSSIRSEISWLLKSNVPDSILHNKAALHIAAFQRIDSLTTAGIKRTAFLVDYRKILLNEKIKKLKAVMIIFVLLCMVLLFYTSFRWIRQQGRTQQKEKELETVLNRINDGVVSVDNNWCYTFLNDAAMQTHPLGKKETLGKSIWDIHPDMKGTVFWNVYQEAMRTGKVKEVESFYEPMKIWFSVKVYPSENGLTIFYKNITESKEADLQLAKNLKEITDYKFALDESSIVAVTDQKGIITHANENFCKISKYSIGELIGQDHRIISSGYHSKEFIKGLWKTIANGEIWKGEMKNKAKDGTVYWVDTTIIPFMNDDGKPYQYVAIRSDITERKKLEDEQKLSASIINSSEDAILSKTLKGIITSWNQGAEKVYGYSAAEVVGKHISIIIPSYLENEEDIIIQKISNGEVVQHFETERVTKAGKILMVSLTISPIKDNEGNIVGASKIARDITFQKEAEEKIIKSERIYKTIASSIPGSVICILDKDYRYLLIEGDMLEKLGYSKEKLLGNKAEEVLDPGVFTQALPRFKSVLGGEADTIEYTIAGYDIVSRYIPLKDENNEVYAIMTVAIDITKLKKAQNDIAELNRNLEEKIKVRTEQLKKSNEEMEAFSYSVSHDLRSPLRSIIGFSAILEEEYGNKLDAEAKRLTGIIKDNTLKMARLIDDLLAFSRTGKQQLSKTSIDTNQLVKEAQQQLLQQEAIYSRITWKIDSLPIVQADLTTIRQVWINLLSNAAKYSSTKEQPVIEVGYREENESIVFIVKDNGVGFDAAYKDKLFKVFQRLHDPHEFEGTGVGLALVDKIVAKHGGKVWAEGKENEGAVFYFSLPL